MNNFEIGAWGDSMIFQIRWPKGPNQIPRRSSVFYPSRSFQGVSNLPKPLTCWKIMELWKKSGIFLEKWFCVCVCMCDTKSLVPIERVLEDLSNEYLTSVFYHLHIPQNSEKSHFHIFKIFHVLNFFLKTGTNMFR